jgi:hypothetical protein
MTWMLGDESTYVEPGGLVEDIRRAEDLASRIARLTAAINAEVGDLVDVTQYGPNDWAANGLIVLGEHLKETAIDMIDVGRAARP